MKVTITVRRNGTSRIQFSPGLNDNSKTDAVFEAKERLVEAIRACQAEEHTELRAS